MELQAMDLAEVRNLVKWIDEQQRKAGQELSQLQQQIVGHEREASDMLRRIQELEGEFPSVQAQIARLSQVDEQMDRLKSEIVHLIEQSDDRRIKSEREMERLRQVEHDAQTRVLTDLREQLTPLPRLVEEMEQRRAETDRLSTAVVTIQNQVPAIEVRLDERIRDVAYLEEAQRQDARRIAELQQGLIEAQKRTEGLSAKQLVVEDVLRRNEAKLDQLLQSELERQQQTDRFFEQGRLADQRRRHELERWADKLGEFEELMAGYARQWRSFEEQHRLSKAATADLHEFKERLERRQNELSELQRVETERMKDQWVEFLQEDEKRQKQQKLEARQWDRERQRQYENYRAELGALQEELEKTAKDIKSLFVLQAKYADTFRQLTRIWLEGYESVVTPPVTRKVPG